MLGNFKDVITRLETQKAAIDQAIATLRALDNGQAVQPVSKTKRAAKKTKQKRTMSPEGRKAIGDAARRRWAAVRKGAKKTSAKG